MSASPELDALLARIKPTLDKYRAAADAADKAIVAFDSSFWAKLLSKLAPEEVSVALPIIVAAAGMLDMLIDDIDNIVDSDATPATPTGATK